MRHKRIRALVLGCAISFLLSACGAAVEDSPLAAVFPDQASRMEASYFECGGMTTWELTQEEFEDLKSWALGLSLEEQTFDEGASPGDRDGGSGYTFQWGEHGFSYILSGDANYVLLEGTWYQVKNPSCPPLEIPGDSAVTAEDVETLDFSKFDMIHLTGITPALSASARAASEVLNEKSRKAGCFFSFDPNLRP